ncbi:hypothetical protein HNP84_001666 [Thermocatellispora tengchongensis]|uniref:Uncharacterized protein n=1 Tax=Thermocatellispora tengchongensis TaxID=1073253 RepID=A0A840P1Z5_9ACTN|nr:hypothetical protein [Thermocatellispora tengchongensis]
MAIFFGHSPAAGVADRSVMSQWFAISVPGHRATHGESPVLAHVTMPDTPMRVRRAICEVQVARTPMRSKRPVPASSW